MIYEWLEANRKDIDILTSFLVTVIPIIMLYSESLGIVENTVPYCILMIILGIASHYADKLSTIVFKTFEQGVNSLCPELVLIV